MSITATRFATRIRTWLLIAALTALLIAIGGAIGGGALSTNSRGLIGTIAAITVAPIAATLLQLGVSRQREYLADATAAMLPGRPRRWPTHWTLFATHPPIAERIRRLRALDRDRDRAVALAA